MGWDFRPVRPGYDLSISGGAILVAPDLSEWELFEMHEGKLATYAGRRGHWNGRGKFIPLPEYSFMFRALDTGT